MKKTPWIQALLLLALSLAGLGCKDASESADVDTNAASDGESDVETQTTNDTDTNIEHDSETGSLADSASGTEANSDSETGSVTSSDSGDEGDSDTASDSGSGGDSCDPPCEGTRTCADGTCIQDHSALITAYDGPKTCATCHPKAMDQIMASTHYKFTAEIQENFMFDHEGKPVTQKYTGKLWKLCGFPTALPVHNWVGKLRDDPATPHIDKPGGCGTCHVGVGIKPYTMSAAEAPSDREKETNVDCLVCHAKNDTRKFYIATEGGEPKLNAMGAPVVYTSPNADGVFDFSGLTEAAKTVGRPTSDNCTGCHAKAGGGGMEIDGVMHSFKRGDGFGPGADVHADAGLTCVDCHSAGNHTFKRGRNNDLSAFDLAQEGDGCVTCHGQEPHSNPIYNNHFEKIACTTCHATSKGGVTYKDFSKTLCPAGEGACTAESLNTWGVDLVKFPENFAITYKWYNHKVEKPIHPMGSREDGKIYPFKKGSFNVPMDASGASIPVKWGKLFVGGDMNAAVSTGLSLYKTWYEAFPSPEDFGLPPVPGVLDHYGEVVDYFSLSHGITKDNALTCNRCHSATDSVIDWTELGYNEIPEI